MRVLLIKTSSLGDVIHTLPALTDALEAIPGIRFDWVVEEGFAEIPVWHPAVAEVIPVAIRRWRKSPLKTLRSGEWQRFRQRLHKHSYDLVIDAQGLFKSAVLTLGLKVPVAGLDRRSAREPLASRFYDKRIAVPRDQHAVERVRQLFAQALGYRLPARVGDYGLYRAWTVGGRSGSPRASKVFRCCPSCRWRGWQPCSPAPAPAWRWTPDWAIWPPRWMCRPCRFTDRPIPAGAAPMVAARCIWPATFPAHPA